MLAAIIIQNHHFPPLISMLSLKSVPDQRSGRNQDRKAVDNKVKFCVFDFTHPVPFTSSIYKVMHEYLITRTEC